MLSEKVKTIFKTKSDFKIRMRAGLFDREIYSAVSYEHIKKYFTNDELRSAMKYAYIIRHPYHTNNNDRTIRYAYISPFVCSFETLWTDLVKLVRW